MFWEVTVSPWVERGSSPAWCYLMGSGEPAENCLHLTGLVSQSAQALLVKYSSLGNLNNRR